jgi:hypothetical protein
MLNRIGEILNLLNSRIAIIKDWKSAFLRTARKGYKQSDLNIGAERVFHNWASALFNFPSSTPIVADLVFDSEEGFRVHIDIKTALDKNPADWQGVVNIGKNQTSYTIPGMFNADIPTRYSDGRIVCQMESCWRFMVIKYQELVRVEEKRGRILGSSIS